MSINEMFTNEGHEPTTSARSLAGTAVLTQHAEVIVNEIFKTINANVAQFKDQLAASKANHDVMDALVLSIHPLTDDDTAVIKDQDEDTLVNMLRSQQSKRSRSKGKSMTLDNYRGMMNAAVCELIIRSALGKEKVPGHRNGATGVFTEGALAAMDHERLAREIRNVQSKKSIMKVKDGFSEDWPEWQQLLVIEAQLKEARDTNFPKAKKPKPEVSDETKNKIAALLGDTDVTSLKSVDSKTLLASIQELIKK